MAHNFAEANEILDKIMKTNREWHTRKSKDTAINYAMVMKAEKWKNEEEWDQNMTHLKIQLELITKNSTTMNTQKVHAVNAHKKVRCEHKFDAACNIQEDGPGSTQMNINAATHDCEVEFDVSIILGHPFLATARALVDAERSDLEFRLKWSGKSCSRRPVMGEGFQGLLTDFESAELKRRRLIMGRELAVGPSFEESFDDDDSSLTLSRLELDLESDGDDGKDSEIGKCPHRR
ncbi:hypothetical protein HAX54_043785 [Datura stramonium]|uniref:Uncharacterized protein n=1 Tax=Datura stramonium TaxID=4076 RepID=A0ABS8W2V4_DATST|nr:hypothetical protein [Datura stramonium]